MTNATEPVILQGKTLDCTNLIKTQSGRTVRDSENFFAFEGEEILSFSTDLDGIQNRRPFDGLSVTKDKHLYKTCVLPKFILIVKMDENLFPIECQLVDKESLKVLENDPDQE